MLPEFPLAFACDPLCDQRYDPGAARPVRLAVLGSFFCPQRSEGVTTVAFLVIHRHKRDAPLAVEMKRHLVAQGPLVVFDGQTDVGSLARVA